MDRFASELLVFGIIMNFFNKDRKKSANIKMLEETLASQIAELKWNSSTKDIKGAAKSGK